MTQVRSHSPRKRSGVYSEEEKAWRGFYQRVGNPDIAVEILHQLDADADMKRSHLALYLCCKESLRTQKTRQARNKRIGQFVRWLADKMCVVPLRTMWRWLHQGRDVAVECLPEIRKEPAVRQVDRLARDAEFAQAKSDFDSQSSAPQQRASKKPRNPFAEVSRAHIVCSEARGAAAPRPVISVSSHVQSTKEQHDTAFHFTVNRIACRRRNRARTCRHDA